MPLLKVDAIELFYGDSHILRGVSLAVNRGQVVALLGRNEVGKTTTLQAMRAIKRSSIFANGYARRRAA